ncbi:MAG: AAA family ATPase, partial [Gemmatimonadaceae bacterium]
PGNHGIYVATIRAILQEASKSPAMARKKVFIIGDAERMVSQEGSDQAANAFLKLLEEPHENTTIIITSSEPGSLLPTIRSRAVLVRVPRLSDTAVRQFLADASVESTLGHQDDSRPVDQWVRLAEGAPGTLFGDDTRAAAVAAARKLIDAATSLRPSAIHAATLAVSASGARGAFSDTLDSLMLLLGERMRSALHDNDENAALAASRASDAVGRARIRAGGNVNPMLITSKLLRELASEMS